MTILIIFTAILFIACIVGSFIDLNPTDEDLGQ
jgi:hypothetical protein